MATIIYQQQYQTISDDVCCSQKKLLWPTRLLYIRIQELVNNFTYVSDAIPKPRDFLITMFFGSNHKLMEQIWIDGFWTLHIIHTVLITLRAHVRSNRSDGW